MSSKRRTIRDSYLPFSVLVAFSKCTWKGKENSFKTYSLQKRVVATCFVQVSLWFLPKHFQGCFWDSSRSLLKWIAKYCCFCTAQTASLSRGMTIGRAASSCHLRKGDGNSVLFFCNPCHLECKLYRSMTYNYRGIFLSKSFICKIFAAFNFI